MSGAPRDRVRAEARRLLMAGVTGQVFPGGVACVSWREADGPEETALACAGVLERDGAKVVESTLYDLAALTHAVVATAALRMADRKAVDLDAPIESLVPDVRGGVLANVTLRSLFTHRAGLEESGGLYLDVPHEMGSPATRRWMVSEAARRPIEDRPSGERVIARSDLGYMIAGEALSRAANAGLEAVIEEHVIGPLGLADQLLFPGALPSDRRAALAREVAPTERCEWRGLLVRGEVHDENAAALGGIAGHAGLFGNAQAVGRFGRAVLDSLRGKSDFVSPARMQEALAPADDGAPWRFGWVAKNGATPSCGRHMGERSFGQVGLTGTSIWLDAERDVVVVLLSNRICPSRANEKIDGFRPAFHDGVLAALG